MANGYARYTGILGGSGGGSGTVTSVAFSDGSTNPIYTISGSPVTTSGTLTETLVTQSANTVFAGPSSGSAAQPSFRALVSADLPSGTGTVTSVSVVSANGFAGTVANSTTTPAITLSTSITGLLQGNGTAISAYTGGNLTDTGTDGIVVTGGTGAVIGSGTSIAQSAASASQNGYLSSANFTIFNNKQPAGNYITALTGDGTAAGPGSAAFTLATVNTNTGSFGSSTAIPNFTVNGKGLITAAGTNAVVAPAGTLTGTTLASNVVSSSLTSVGTIATGVWNGTTIAIANGGTGQTTASAAFNALSPMTTAGDIIYENSTPSGARLPIGTTGQVLTVSGGLPSWQAAGSGVTGNYWSGYTTNAVWTTSSTTYVDGTNTGGNGLATRISNGITVTAGASNVAGITFTPASSSSVYHITASFCGNGQTGGAGACFQLTDGTSVITTASNQIAQTADQQNVKMTGLYAPGTGSAVTVKIQMAAKGGGTTQIERITAGDLNPIIEWSLFQIA